MTHTFILKSALFFKKSALFRCFFTQNWSTTPVYWKNDGIFIMHLLPSQMKAGFPLRLENLEKWEGIFQSGKSQGILNRLEKSGKITQNTGKLRDFQTNIICYFLVIFKLTVYYFAEMHQVFS